MIAAKDYKFWFCTGSQDLYGDECLPHTAHDMPVLPVAVRGLVLIHEIHIYTVVRNLLIELRMQMAERFPKTLL